MGRMPTGKGSSFVPREMLQPRSSFGGSQVRLEPAAGLKSWDRRVRGAQIQHLVMHCLRGELKRHEIPLKVYAVHQGMSLDRLYRLLRGEALMQVADLTSFTFSFPEVRKVAIEFMSEARDPNADLPEELPAPPLTAEQLVSESRHPGHKINVSIH